jgi:hypothetical protein
MQNVLIKVSPFIFQEMVAKGGMYGFSAARNGFFVCSQRYQIQTPV